MWTNSRTLRAIRTTCVVRTTGYARDIYVPSDYRTMGYARDIYVWPDHLLRAMPVIFTFGPIVCYGLCPWYLRLSRLSYHGLCSWYLRLARSSYYGLCPRHLRSVRSSYYGICSWYLRLVRPSTTGYARDIYVWSDRLLRSMPVIFTFRPIIVLWAMLVIFMFGLIICYGQCPWL